MNPLLFTPLALSQLLKEKGVKQESMFYWGDNADGQWVVALDFDPKGDKDPIVAFGDMLKDDEDGGYFCAFTLSELPDVFRQVFGEMKVWNGRYRSDWEWERFSNQYFSEPNESWQNIERTINSL